MKTLVAGFCLFGIVLSLCFGCTNSSSGKGDLIVVDTKANFPEKEICIQDLADVSYIPLYISDSTLVLRIFSVTPDGIAAEGEKKCILLFTPDGKALQGMVSRNGEGPEEYSGICDYFVDWKRKEVFVFQDFRSVKVYDFQGRFLRELLANNRSRLAFASVGVSDFVCTYSNNEMQTGSRPYFRFSKETGKVDTLDAVTVNEQIFINRKILWDDGRETQAKGGVNCLFSMMDAGFLTNPSLDTVFQVLPDWSMKAVVMPAVSPRKDKNVPLLDFLGASDSYLWAQFHVRHVTVRMSDMMAGRREDSPSVNMYDFRTGEWCVPKYVNRDFSSESCYLSQYINLFAVPYGYGMMTLGAPELIEAREAGEVVNDELNQLISSLDEESNPVIVLLKFKSASGR